MKEIGIRMVNEFFYEGKIPCSDRTGGLEHLKKSHPGVFRVLKTLG